MQTEASAFDPVNSHKRSLKSGLFYFNLVMFYVYILRSEKLGFYYKGQTSDLARRIKEHNKSIIMVRRSQHQLAQKFMLIQ